MRNVVQWLIKTVVAGILAILVASTFCLIYYNPGIHITNKTGVTDYVWESNHFTSTMKEGIAWNYIDKNGFYNKSCTDKNMSILVMGSSQMEGTNVFSRQKTSYLIEEFTGKTTYNIGISSHNLLVCVKNLETALTVMQPTEYVIIETGTIKFTEEKITDCLSGNMENLSSYDSGLLYYLQKIPFFKLVYSQLKSWEGVTNNAVTTENDTLIVENIIPNNAYEQLIAKIYDVCIKYNVQPIIVYHPHMAINGDGTISADHEDLYLNAFEYACKVNNVFFIDMTEDFLHMYTADYTLPHGFCNTAVGIGHLNKYGHKAIAKRLSEFISANYVHTEGEN